MKKYSLALALLSVSSAHAERWLPKSSPHFFPSAINKSTTYDLFKLPLSGKLKDDRLGWSETYWPSMYGGIAFRWNAKNPQPFKYKLHSKEELMRMSAEELAELSPAELYDISQGNYKYPLTKKILKMYGPDNLWWEGICHGWAQAAVNYPEPKPVTVTNKDGIRVEFGASDVKGLLSMHEAFNSDGLYSRLGDRCKVYGKVPGEAFEEDGDISMPDEEDANIPSCSDVNAGAFHVAITNMIGIHDVGFVADVDRFGDVWNQPVIGYDSTILQEVPVRNEEKAYGVSKKYKVRLDMHYGDELDLFFPTKTYKPEDKFVSKIPVTGTPEQVTSTRNYEYFLEVDSTGAIIGGEWISVTRPDMIWLKLKDNKFRNGRFPLAGLEQIYRPVTR